MRTQLKDRFITAAAKRKRLRFKLRSIFAATFFFCLTVPAVADADNNKALARTLFETGVEEFSAGRYESALAAFEESYHIRPTPSLLYNIGMCQKALFRYTDAVESFSRYLAEVAGPSDKHAKRVRKEIEDLSGLLVPLKLDGLPAGASVMLDDKHLGAAPLKNNLLIDPGPHTLTVQLSGHAAFEESIRGVSSSPLTIRVDLDPLPSRLEVQCDSADATVKIDEVPHPGCPFYAVLPAGKHELRVEAPGRMAFEQSLFVRAGETSVVWAQLPQRHIADVHTSPENHRRLRIAGFVALAVGAGAGAVGGYYTYLGERDHSAGMNAIEQQNLEHYEDIKNKRLPFDKAMMATGYATAGVFLATGVVLLLASRPSEETKATLQNIGFIPLPDGFAVRF